MKVLRTIDEVRVHRSRVGSAALVPTMGAFHEGHLELMRRASSLCDTVYVSLFVNPTQFGQGEDFSGYPRDEARDLSLAESAGADVVFAPSVEEMYRDRSAVVRVTGVSEKWEGAHRPGHFDGVATVVAKLFNIFAPDVAVFGLKDLQQCAVVRRLVSGLDFPLRLELVETVRDGNGLALSSRNAYLTEGQRSEAAYLHRTLSVCAAAVRAVPANTRETLDSSSRLLTDQGFRVDYLACVDPLTMQESTDVSNQLRIVFAAHYHSVRLIDNVPV